MVTQQSMLKIVGNNKFKKQAEQQNQFVNHQHQMGCAQSQNNNNHSGILSKPHIFFIIGGPGCGKGTQCEKLVQEYKFKHLSTGDLLRAEKQKGGRDAQQIAALIARGELVSSKMVVRLIKKAIVENGNRRYLIDGFPRNQQNLTVFKQEFRNSVLIRNLIFIDCPRDVMQARILQRAKTSGRTDDNQATVQHRLQTYEKETHPIILKFKEEGMCVQIQGNQVPQQVYKELQQQLEHIAVYPPPLVQCYSIIGGPGSGKGTQSALMVQKYGFKHLSTGDLLRAEVKQGTTLGKQLDALMKDGKLVSSEILVTLMKKQFERNNFGGRYLIDGFPRNQQNIDVWDKIMKTTAEIKTVLYFHCTEDELKKRLLERGKTSGRSDDNQSSITNRLKVFSQATTPIVNYYKRANKLKEFDAGQSIDSVFSSLESYLASNNIRPRQSRNEMKVILVLGGPGSGKGTQCLRLKGKFGFKHISTGDLLREEIQSNGIHADNIKEVISAGRMVSSELLVKLIRSAFELDGYQGTFLLDGFPRNEENIEKWKAQFGSQIQFSNLINFECSEQELENRLINRGKSSGRSDDNPATIKARISTFKKQTQPVVKKMSTSDKFIISVNGERTADEVYKELQKKLIDAGYK